MLGYRHARGGLGKRNRASPFQAPPPRLHAPALWPVPNPPLSTSKRPVADNRRVRCDYHVEETFEAGLALQGTEVKALRAGEASIKESYAEVRDGQVWLVNANIPEYSHGNRLNHEPRRPRKLLLHAREIEKLFGAVERKGMTLRWFRCRSISTRPAGRRSSLRWPRANRRMTSASRSRNATGSATRHG